MLVYPSQGKTTRQLVFLKFLFLPRGAMVDRRVSSLVLRVFLHIAMQTVTEALVEATELFKNTPTP